MERITTSILRHKSCYDVFRVPFVPSPQNVAERMLSLGNTKPGSIVVDLGAGDGRILALAVQKFGARAIGIEFNQDRCNAMNKWINAKNLQNFVRVIQDDFFNVDLSNADVVTMYLLTSVNTQIRPKLERELKDGAHVVTHDFPINGWFPMRIESVENENKTHTIYSYQLPRSQRVGSRIEASIRPSA